MFPHLSEEPRLYWGPCIVRLFVMGKVTLAKYFAYAILKKTLKKSLNIPFKNLKKSLTNVFLNLFYIADSNHRKFVIKNQLNSEDWTG